MKIFNFLFVGSGALFLHPVLRPPTPRRSLSALTSDSVAKPRFFSTSELFSFSSKTMKIEKNSDGKINAIDVAFFTT